MSTMVWTVAEVNMGDGAGPQPQLLVLPEEVAAHWRARVPVLRCSTWGQVRGLGPDVFEEVLGLAGYGDYEEAVAHFSIEGEAPGLAPLVTHEAELALRRAEGAPSDDTAFNAYEDLGAVGDGDWPPSIHYLVATHLPSDLITRYGETWVTVFNGRYAMLPGGCRDEVLAALEASGHRMVEAPWLSELLDDVS